jgi:hypothetical protein
MRRPNPRLKLSARGGRRRPQLKRNPLGCSDRTPLLGFALPLRQLKQPLLALLLGTGLACRSAPPSVRQLAGCYELRLSPWEVPTLARMTPNSPPDTIQLDPIAITGQGEAPGYRVRPNIFAPPYHHDISPSWEPIGDSIRITWTDGFSGIRLVVAVAD